MNLHALNTALSLGSILTSLGEDNEGISYDALKSAVTGVELDCIQDAMECCDTDSTMVAYLSFMGVSDAVIEDMVSGRVNVSEDAIMALSGAFASHYNEDDIENLAEEFAGVNEIQLDALDGDNISPPACKSGYKRRMVIKNGKPTWKCVRMFGRVRLSAKQKQALRKARRKSHTASAKFARKRSVKVGQRKGLY